MILLYNNTKTLQSSSSSAEAGCYLPGVVVTASTPHHLLHQVLLILRTSIIYEYYTPSYIVHTALELVLPGSYDI